MNIVDKIAKCREQDEQRLYLLEFERRTKGLNFLSSGICAKCSDCQSNYDYPTAKKLQSAIDNGLIDDEGNFSRCGCDTCGSSLGQKIYDGHAYIELDGKKVLTHLDLCEDCVMFIANGQLPKNWEG